MIETPKAFPDPRVEQPCQPEQVESPTSLEGSTYDPRDLIIANLSIENEILKKRLKDFREMSATTRSTLESALSSLAQFRDGWMY